jgi:hypothetical protein
MDQVSRFEVFVTMASTAAIVDKVLGCDEMGAGVLDEC